MMVRVCHMGATFSLLSFIFAWPIWASDVQEALKTNADWQSFGGVPSGGQYSALNQININNVGNLERAWVAHTGDVVKGSAVDGGSSFQASPIFWNDTLYICTPMNRTIAVNAKTGEEVWAFDGFSTLSSEMPKFAANCRGVAFWSDANAKLSGELCSSRVIQPDVLGNLYSIDAQTGQLCSDFGDGGRLNLNEFEYFGEGGIFFASPPAVFDDYLIVGGGVGDNMYADAADGIVRGLDVRTGQQRWSFNPIPKELSDSTGGANVWSMFSIDQESEIVYLPTSSPSVDPFGGLRHDPIPYANSLVALNARTGEVVWHQQLVHHDVFDYDLPAQPILIDIKKSDGQIVEAVVQITKMGFIFVFDRHTGEAVFPIEERAVPGSDIQGEQVSLTQPFPLVPEPFARQGVTEDDIWGLTFLDRGWCSSKYKRLRNDGFYTPPSLEGTLQMPSALGGGNWGGAAVDPQSNTLIVKTQNLATIIKLIPADINEVRHKRRRKALNATGVEYLCS
jgi:quinoprotein glucose dehydrogenase